MINITLKPSRNHSLISIKPLTEFKRCYFFQLLLKLFFTCYRILVYNKIFIRITSEQQQHLANTLFFHSQHLYKCTLLALYSEHLLIANKFWVTKVFVVQRRERLYRLFLFLKMLNFFKHICTCLMQKMCTVFENINMYLFVCIKKKNNLHRKCRLFKCLKIHILCTNCVQHNFYYMIFLK